MYVLKHLKKQFCDLLSVVVLELVKSVLISELYVAFWWGNDDVILLSISVSEPADQGHVLYLLQTILSLFNTSSLSGGVRPKILDVVLHVVDEMQNIEYIVLPIISAGECNEWKPSNFCKTIYVSSIFVLVSTPFTDCFWKSLEYQNQQL